MDDEVPCTGNNTLLDRPSAPRPRDIRFATAGDMTKPGQRKRASALQAVDEDRPIVGIEAQRQRPGRIHKEPCAKDQNWHPAFRKAMPCRPTVVAIVWRGSAALSILLMCHGARNS